MAATFTPSELNGTLDYVGNIAHDLLIAYGQRTAGDPIATWPASGAGLEEKNLEDNFLANYADLEASNLLGPSIYQLRGQMSHVAVLANTFSDLFSRLGQATQGMAVGPNVITLDQWLAYYNVGVGGTNTALQGPYLRYVMECLGMNPNRANFCYVAYSAGLHVGSQTGAVFTVGTRTVDTAKYVGGSPKLKFVTFSSNNGAVEVTGEGWDPATQSIVAGKTWVTTGGTFTAALEERDLIPGGASPAPANALLTKATAMTGVNAGNRFDVRLYAPAGRVFDEWMV